MSVDKSLRGVSCVECRFCFFDESLKSSFSDSEVGIFFFFNFLENQIKSHSEVVGRVHVSGEPGGRVPELHLVPCVSTDISCRVSFTMIL